ncbi:MAG: alanine--tRNA ligase [Candidatus Levybacteria bacterium]|nr:alanine--tRNA ligase [Candidatus Levybacteria bacterium]
MTSAQIRQKYLKFFADRGHAIIPSASLVPENDPTTLFISAGMQPLILNILGQPHPLGKRLVNSQKTIRMQDIEEVGDNRHTTFFEMLGNWSFGSYFKKEQLSWIFEFLTQGLGLNPNRLFISVFEGNQSVPKDIESIKIWKGLFSEVGIKAEEKERIFTYPASKNWWSRAGEPEKMPTGEPGGPDSEVFYDFGQEKLIHENSIYKNEQCHPNCDCGRFMEIANSVFMQYQKQPDGSLHELEQKSVDFGGGLERLSAVVNNDPDVFTTDLFADIIKEIEKFTDKKYSDERNRSAIRTIADHLKAATFLIKDGVCPSNKLQGYILRRLIRRAAVKMHQLNGGLTPIPAFNQICDTVIRLYSDAGVYFNQAIDREKLWPVIEEELTRFSKSLDRGLKEFNKYPSDQLNELNAFNLFQSYGFPYEITEELFKQKGGKLEKEIFNQIFEEHRQLSQTTAAKVFKGGLADHSESVTKLHTATHLLHAALRKFVGSHVQQKGSNITSERLRFDFTQNAKLADEQKQKIETWINQQIAKDLPVAGTTDSLSGAKAGGALAFFGEKYGEKVTVYTIGNEKTGIVSKEVCGGPHVTRTGVLGLFKLGKEETVSAGVRRVYAFLPPK